MSNKFLALLILIGTISGMCLLYFYFFVGYTSTVTIQSNISDYQVEFYNKKVGNTFEYTCELSPCVLPDISPLSYSIRIRKDGYKPVSQDLDVNPRASQTITINAIKEISFSEVNQQKEELSNKDKISSLRDKNKAYKYFDLSTGSYAYFSDSGQLYLYRNSSIEKIGDFTFAETDILDFKDILNTQYVYFQIGENKYIYDLDRGTLSVLDLGVEVLYIKSGNSSSELVFITSVGSYIYSIRTNSFEYFYLFKDFIYVDDSYIGIIYADEDKKLRNFDLEDTTSNLIIRYNPLSKQKQILYETNLDISKIYRENGEIIFEVGENKYKLDNI